MQESQIRMDKEKLDKFEKVLAFTQNQIDGENVLQKLQLEKKEHPETLKLKL